MGRTTKDSGERKKISWRIKRERREVRRAKQTASDYPPNDDPPRRVPPGARLWRGRETDDSK